MTADVLETRAAATRALDDVERQARLIRNNGKRRRLLAEVERTRTKLARTMERRLRMLERGAVGLTR